MDNKRATEGIDLEDGVLSTESAFPSFLPSVFEYLISLWGTVSVLLAWDWEEYPPSRLSGQKPGQGTLSGRCVRGRCVGVGPGTTPFKS